MLFQLKFLLLALLGASSVHALYFILEGVEQKCFIEELPKDTTVLGKYTATEWNAGLGKYQENVQQVILISVESVALRHRVLNQKGSPKGKFTFTSTDFGEHLICVTANGGANGWFEHSRTKLEFDLIFGDVAHADSGSSSKQTVDDLSVRVRSLKYVVNNILNEQKYQRDREAEFRDFSESINGKVVRWTLLQIFVLVLVGYLQTRYLKQFLVSKKII
ncbi:UNVERIFIED_CONTAM: emp24p/erv25p- protein [Siphonaria sp. JEL0065]|nr:emp24p/erv25p- protein [Siphonaria sp. JEL0065]